MCKKGTVAACILYITNGCTMVVSMAGLAVGIWLLVADTAVTNSIPDYLAVAITVIMAVVLLVSGLGVFATVAQMKENQDSDPNTGSALGKEGCCTKDCCNSCGISLYGFLAIFGSLLAFAMGVVALHYSAALPNEITNLYANTTTVATIEGWFSDLDSYIDTTVYSAILSSTGGGDWIDTQDLLGCCGWNDTSADPSIYLTGSCCSNSDGSNRTLVDSLSEDSIQQLFNGDVSVTFSECNTIDSAVLTCKGIMLYTTESNLLAVGIVLLVLFFILLVCFVCALVVRYCAGGQGSSAAVKPMEEGSLAKVDLNDDKTSSSGGAASSAGGSSSKSAEV